MVSGTFKMDNDLPRIILAMRSLSIQRVLFHFSPPPNAQTTSTMTTFLFSRTSVFTPASTPPNSPSSSSARTPTHQTLAHSTSTASNAQKRSREGRPERAPAQTRALTPLVKRSMLREALADAIDHRPSLVHHSSLVQDCRSSFPVT